MKRLTCFTSIFLFFCILVSCSQPTATVEPTPEYIEGMINLGDEIDGIVFTTLDEYAEDMDIAAYSYCGWEPIEVSDEVIDNITYKIFNYECAASPGDPIFIGCAELVEGFNTEDLDGDWIKQKVVWIFDGQEINLSPFGSVDYTTYNGLKGRAWNVMVENITPGTHTIYCERDVNDRVVEMTFVITVPSGTETYPTLSAEVVPGQHPFTSEKAKLNYFLYIPDGYGIEPQDKWPLILSLHGLDQGAFNSMDVLENILFLSPENLDDLPFFIVSPQGTQEYAEYEIWATDEIVSALMTLLDEIQAMLPVDTSRIYLTGDSAGGNGTWAIGLRHPERFAALVPVMGYYGWPFAVPENICDLVDTPVWAFHGAEDELVPLEAEQKIVDALKDCGGDVQFTVLPGIGHDVSHKTVYTEELFTWLLEQTLE